MPLSPIRQSELPNDSPYPVAVPWLDDSFGYYALPGDFSLSQSPCFRNGRVYGQDVSSGAAVAALLTNQYDANEKPKQQQQHHQPVGDKNLRVLDLCCSPGLKLCAMADWLNANATIVGVDVSESRMATCKRIVHKYHIDPKTRGGNDPDSKNAPRIRLYCTDGTTFGTTDDTLNLVFDSEVAKEEQASSLGKRKRMNKSARARERKRLKQLVGLDRNESTQESGPVIELFDRVLVDAECSTDGSLKHIQKRLEKEQAGDRERLVSQLTDNQQLSELVALQKKLAASGFRLLKPGGYMVYSTCSLSEDQNDGVVRWLLELHSEACIVPLRFGAGRSDEKEFICEGSIPGTIRFLPNTGGPVSSKNSSIPQVDEVDCGYGLFGGGFYAAKIEKMRR